MLALEILFLYVGCTLAMMLHEEVQEILLSNISCYPNEFYLLYSKSIMFELNIFFFFRIFHEAL